MSNKLGLELSYKLFVKVDLAQRARSLISTPGQNTIAVEKVTNIARQRNYFLPFLEPLHAERALVAPLEQVAVEGALVEG